MKQRKSDNTSIPKYSKRSSRKSDNSSIPKYSKTPSNIREFLPSRSPKYSKRSSRKSDNSSSPKYSKRSSRKSDNSSIPKYSKTPSNIREFLPSKKTKKKLETLLSPTKKSKKQSLFKGSLFTRENVVKTSYKGNGEDLFFSFSYLMEKYNDIFFIPMGDFNDFNIMWNVLTSWKCGNSKEYKLTLPKPKKKFIKDIIKIFTSDKNKIKFILLPIYLGSSDCNIEQGHFNIAIVDVKRKTYERFEPYGYNINITKHRPFNANMVKIFKEANIKLKIIEPNKLMPKYSFQDLEEEEIENNYASIRKNDPGGFCGAWSVWYVELVIRNTHLNRKQLINKAIKKIEDIKINFREFIRNYSVHLNNYRKIVLARVSEDCGKSLGGNDYFNCTKKYIIDIYKKKF